MPTRQSELLEFIAQLHSVHSMKSSPGQDEMDCTGASSDIVDIQSSRRLSWINLVLLSIFGIVQVEPPE